ncbi:MAG: S41 family peptidase [Planctomycetota bacterium]|nr:S41 family peptidase [Planctomycetota bacterium]
MLRALVLTTLLVATPAAAGPDEISPFDMVRWAGTDVQVQVDGKWYELVKLNGLPKAEVIRACKQLDPGNWEKRFCEDLVAALARTTSPLGRKVELVVIDVKTKKQRTLRNVKATRDKRNTIRDARPWRDKGAASGRRIEREHAQRAAPMWKWLTVRHYGPERRPRLTADQARADLDELEWRIQHEYSYRDLKKGVDYRGALDAVRATLGDSIAVSDFHIQLRKVVALFGDGHSRVRGVWGALPVGFLPCRLFDDAGRVAAMGERGLLDDKRPYLVAIDGVKLDRWLDAAARINADGSPQLKRSFALQALPFVRFLRAELGKKHSETVKLTLADADGKNRTTIARPLAAGGAGVRFRFGTDAKLLDGNVGYLPLRDMSLSREQAEAVAKSVLRFKDTIGIIIDVRGNGGGSRDALRALFPYFMATNEPPYVANIAAYRLPPGAQRDVPEGHLSNRFLVPATHPALGDAQRAAIERAAAAFRPRWKVAPTEFSDWHYLLLERGTLHGTFHYQNRVIVLIDEGCFSATDIFVGAFAGRSGVTLMGTATGGGSGRAGQFRLPQSRLRVKLSSMASFRPDGRIYDGAGIAPDVEARLTLQDLLAGRDSVLEKARKALAKGPR